MILLYFIIGTLLLHILMMYVTRYIIKNKSEKHILRRTCDESGLISEFDEYTERECVTLCES